jgi:hypothetical protein
METVKDTAAERRHRRRLLYEAALERQQIVTKEQAIEVLAVHAALAGFAGQLTDGGDPARRRRVELDELARAFLEAHWAALPAWRRARSRRAGLSTVESHAWANSVS